MKDKGEGGVIDGHRAIFLDSELHLLPESSAKRTPAELHLLDFAEVLQRLEQLTDQLTESGNYFETFFTEHRFIYNIHTLIMNHSIHCCLLSEPMVIQPFNEQRI